MKTALTIAGSDSSGGAGIQADLKTMLANGVYGMSVITALTAQNTVGVRSILNVDSKFLKDQISSVFEDIYPDAVKIGMVSDAALTIASSSSIPLARFDAIALESTQPVPCVLLVSILFPLNHLIFPFS